MFTANLTYIKARQAELHREAADYRLAQSLSKPKQWTSIIVSAVGKLLISSGQQLLNRYQPAN